MRLGTCFLLLTMTILSSCTQKISRDDIVGHWYETDYGDEYILNADGTGSAGNEALTGLSDCSWEYRNDSLIVFKHGRQEIYEVIKITKRKGKKKMITQLYLLEHGIGYFDGEPYTQEILWEDELDFYE